MTQQTIVNLITDIVTIRSEKERERGASILHGNHNLWMTIKTEKRNGEWEEILTEREIEIDREKEEMEPKSMT